MSRGARYDPEAQIILLSAGTAARRQASRSQMSQLMADVDWSRLADTLRMRRLLPALGPRIVDLAEAHASDDFAAAVVGAVDAGRRQGAFLQLMSLRVIAMLAEAGIPAAPLKGPLLGEAIYGDPGRRLSSDIDLLVAPEQLNAAVDVVRGLGYEAPRDYVGRGGLPLLHFVLEHDRGELPPIELHWRVHYYEGAFARERLLPGAGDPSGNWRPAPAAELVALLLFYARDGFIDLSLATDLSAWWDTYRSALPAGAVDDLLHSYPELERATAVALKVAEKVVGVPAGAVIRGMPNLGVRGRMARRLANPNPRTSQSQLYADMGLVDGLLTPRGGFKAFARRQLLPPREVLAQQARHGAKRRRRSSLGRLVGTLVRYCLTMTRLLREHETRL